MAQEFETNWAFKKAIKEAGFTLTKLEKVTGINRSFISLFANGRYLLDESQKNKITRALRKVKPDLSRDEIFGG